MGKVRTQIQLERRQYERLKQLARRRGESLSAVIRELLDERLGGISAETAHDARLRLVGSGHDAEGNRSVARRHDEYLYGGRR